MSVFAFAPDFPVLPGAACIGSDPEIFFPVDRNLHQHRAEQARNICRRCPAIRACLTWSLAHDEEGIWAATDHDQRRELLARASKESA